MPEQGDCCGWAPERKKNSVGCWSRWKWGRETVRELKNKQQEVARQQRVKKLAAGAEETGVKTGAEGTRETGIEAGGTGVASC